MKEQFREKLSLNRANIKRLETINGICEEYRGQGYRLTLRQLYYQLVSRDIIPNVQKEYSKLSKILVKGRMTGIVDWDIIEDRIRVPFLPYYVHGVEDAISDTVSQYRLDRMNNQEVYIELWVEKDALSGVLRPITAEYHINLMVNRGYSSCTAMKDAADRIKNQSDKTATILYLGDHDPSGLDMVRDIAARLSEFDATVDVEHIGLTTAQVKKYNPPPNPVKFTDTRASGYIAQFGKKSWEVDALNPKTLNQIIRGRIEKLIDIDLFNERLDDEKHDIKDLESLLKKRK